MVERCSLCGGINLPHPLDEYHVFLQQLQYTKEHLENARNVSTNLPSIQIQLQQTIVSVIDLIEKSKQI